MLYSHFVRTPQIWVYPIIYFVLSVGVLKIPGGQLERYIQRSCIFQDIHEEPKSREGWGYSEKVLVYFLLPVSQKKNARPLI